MQQVISLYTLQGANKTWSLQDVPQAFCAHLEVSSSWLKSHYFYEEQRSRIWPSHVTGFLQLLFATLGELRYSYSGRTSNEILLLYFTAEQPCYGY